MIEKGSIVYAKNTKHGKHVGVKRFKVLFLINNAYGNKVRLEDLDTKCVCTYNVHNIFMTRQEAELGREYTNDEEN